MIKIPTTLILPVTTSAVLAGLFAASIAGLKPNETPAPPVPFSSSAFEACLKTTRESIRIPQNPDYTDGIDALNKSAKATTELAKAAHSTLGTISKSSADSTIKLTKIGTELGMIKTFLEKLPGSQDPQLLDQEIRTALRDLNAKINDLVGKGMEHSFRSPELPHYYLLAEKGVCDIPDLKLAVIVTGISKDQVTGIRITRRGAPKGGPSLAQWVSADYASRMEFSSDGKKYAVRFMSMIDRFWLLSNYTLIEIVAITPISNSTERF